MNNNVHSFVDSRLDDYALRRLDEDQVNELFQDLYDHGLITLCNSHHQRKMEELIHAGEINIGTDDTGEDDA